MSYLNKLSEAERAKLNSINSSIRGFYENARNYFSAQNSGQDFANTVLKIENAKFANDCSITGEFDCSIGFKNCYFLNDIIFYDCKFLKSFVFSLLKYHIAHKKVKF